MGVPGVLIGKCGEQDPEPPIDVILFAPTSTYTDCPHTDRLTNIAVHFTDWRNLSVTSVHQAARYTCKFSETSRSRREREFLGSLLVLELDPYQVAHIVSFIAIVKLCGFSPTPITPTFKAVFFPCHPKARFSIYANHPGLVRRRSAVTSTSWKSNSERSSMR